MKEMCPERQHVFDEKKKRLLMPYYVKDTLSDRKLRNIPPGLSKVIFIAIVSFIISLHSL